MFKLRVGALTGVAQQVLGHVALFQLPVTRKPHKMGPISQGDKVIRVNQLYLLILNDLTARNRFQQCAAL